VKNDGIWEVTFVTTGDLWAILGIRGFKEIVSKRYYVDKDTYNTLGF
jgi:hypothetical protein